MLATTASPAKRPFPPPPKVHHTPVPAAVSTVSADYTRLHITPFDADLLPVVLPASVRPDARNISFHSLQTFPEKRYGFVDLPADAAVKLRRKLNGAVLKGVKLSIEPARQAREDKYAQERTLLAADMAKRTAEEQALRDEEKKERRERKARREQEKQAQQEKRDKTRTGWDKLEEAKAKRQEIVGVQLDDRPVKRGWTEPPTDQQPEAKRKYHSKEGKELARQERKARKEEKKKQREKSAYTDGPECLFKTILPASKVAVAKKDVPVGSDGEIDERAAKRQRKQERKAREVVVHEFANWTRIPNFIKSTTGTAASSAANLEYVDGKGWVNADSGDVVEALKSTRSNTVTALVTKEEQLAKRARFEARKAEAEAEAAKLAKAGGGDKAASESETSDSGSDTGSDMSSDESSSDEEAEEDEDEEEAASTETAVDDAAETESRPKSSSSAKSLTIKIPPPPNPVVASTSAAAAAATAPLTPAKVHPLEALYKRTAATQDKPGSGVAETKPASEQEKPFSFFGDVAGDDIEEDDNDDEDAANAMQVDVTEPEPESESVPQPPMTPFTKQDVEWRTTRSAAPTPDTAHPSRSKPFWAAGNDSDEDEDEDEDGNDDKNDADEDGSDPKKDKADATTNFQSWFWDNRGDLNRSWKRRRKTAAKEKRYRENRARNERAI